MNTVISSLRVSSLTNKGFSSYLSRDFVEFLLYVSLSPCPSSLALIQDRFRVILIQYRVRYLHLQIQLCQNGDTTSWNSLALCFLLLCLVMLIYYFYCICKCICSISTCLLFVCLASSALSLAVGTVLRIVWLCSSSLPKGQITHCILVWNVRTLIVFNNLSVYLKDQYKIRIAFFRQTMSFTVPQTLNMQSQEVPF